MLISVKRSNYNFCSISVDSYDKDLLDVMTGLADGSRLVSPDDHDAILSTQTEPGINLGF